LAGIWRRGRARARPLRRACAHPLPRRATLSAGQQHHQQTPLSSVNAETGAQHPNSKPLYPRRRQQPYLPPTPSPPRYLSSMPPPATQQHMQRNQLLCPSFAVSPGHMLTPISGFSPQMQHTVTSPVLQAICSDFWPEVCNDSLDSFEPVSPVYVPPISPSILIQFLMSPDYSLLQSNPVATGFSSRPFKWSGPVVLDSLDHN
jgi:hypothetical protein